MKKKQQNIKKIKMIMILAVFLFLMIIAGSIVGISKMVTDVKQSLVVDTPDVVLANAGVENGSNIKLAVNYVDQRQDECINMYDEGADELVAARQFEWSSCGYGATGIEAGLVDFELSEKYLPTSFAGKSIPNRGMSDLARWFEAVEGKSKKYAGTLELTYHSENVEFGYENNNFYPLDEIDFSNGDSGNIDGHNHLFTMDFAVPFTVLGSGSEVFEIKADDDTFVFVNNKLALDMGGVHGATTGRFEITKDGEIYTGVGGQDLAYSGITVSPNSGDVVRIFHADRDSESSVFDVKFRGMKLAVMNTELASGDGVQIAYDPSDPSYVAPLGESEVTKPKLTKQYIIVMTVLAMVVVVFAMGAAMMLHRVLNR